MSAYLPVPLALVPVLLFLALLRAADVYRLVPVRSTVRSVLIGGATALVAAFLNRWLMDVLGASTGTMTRYVGPVVEEFLKSLWIVFLLRSHRVGFQVDAAIHGFAVGAGFALLENVYYLVQVTDAPLALWLVRGTGTAVMHGCATAIFAILAKELEDQRRWSAAFALLVPWSVALALHSGFNHFHLPPLTSALVLVTVFPLITWAVLVRSERATREWVQTGFDDDAEMLQVILSGDLPESPLGQYLNGIQHSFPGDVMADMVAYLQLGKELSLIGKGMLMAREAGVELGVDEELREKLDEFRWLEDRLGAAGRRALSPVVDRSERDLWQVFALDDASRGA